MMKRIMALFVVSFLVMSVLLGCSCALAEGETFTIRNEITFGMTKNEVIERETALRNNANNISTECEYVDVSIAGINGCKLYYLFDDANKLYRVHIYFYPDNDKYIRDVTAKANYTAVNNVLVSKYGNSLGNKDGYTHSVQTKALEFHLKTVDLTKLLMAIRGAGKLAEQYDEWVIRVDGGYIKMDHMFSHLSGIDGTACTHELDYTFYTEAEWNQIVQNFSDGL